MPCNDQGAFNRGLLDHRGQQPQVHGCLSPSDEAQNVHGIDIACDLAPSSGVHGLNIAVERHPAAEKVLTASFVRVQQRVNQVTRCQRVTMTPHPAISPKNVCENLLIE